MKKKIGIILLSFCLFHQLAAQTVSQFSSNDDTLNYVFKLHGQTRRYKVVIEQHAKNTYWKWSIIRHMKEQTGSIIISNQGLMNGTMLSFAQPVKGDKLFLKNDETFACISQAAFQSLITKGYFICNHTTFRRKKEEGKFYFHGKYYPLIKTIADVDGTEYWIAKNAILPLICKVSKSPLGIDWTIK
ncbi:hypothetical protein [uncultured Bacteroides sp.]|uniref:hypothetical protein n=1 Tax=uncultured Bacteroides sp. TaxID=162156 RepID=UPI002AAB1EF9|nr:hypothetical protein [uncultured Bacteroides sp.]